jgi:signal transduction histidine kinase
MAKTGPGLPPRDAAGVPGQEELITLNRSATVARLVAGVFHELNNALQVIGGLAELLQDSPGIPPPVADGSLARRPMCAVV